MHQCIATVPHHPASVIDVAQHGLEAPCHIDRAAMLHGRACCRPHNPTLNLASGLQVYLAHMPSTVWGGAPPPAALWPAAWGSALPAALDWLLWRAVLLREVLALGYYWARGWLC